VFWRLRNLKHYGAGETVGILRIAPVIVEEVGSGSSVVALPAFKKCCATFIILPDWRHCFVDRDWIGPKVLDV